MKIILLICSLFTGLTIKAQSPVIKVAILLYPGIDLQDFAAPADVFTKAATITQGEYQLYTVSLGQEIVYTAGHIGIKPDYSVKQLPKPDILVIPGAPMQVVDSSGLKTFIRQYQDSVSVLLSVGTGAYLLAGAGLLDHQQATTYYYVADDFASAFPQVTLVKDVRYVDEGNIITTVGIDGVLHLIRRYSGDRIADMVARSMQYTPHREEIWPLAPTGMNASQDADVVCGMITIDKNIHVMHEGRNYFFCSEICKKTFLRNPAKYLLPLK
jgi:transcriptional regulator GlxA family with amidase domain